MPERIAIDTNLIVRILTNDEPVQARRAAKLVESNPVWIPKTVLLETEWVLRSLYGFRAAVIHESFCRFLSLPDVLMEDQAVVWRALDAYEKGMDFADALHMGSAGTVSRFASFDRDLAKKAKHVGVSFPAVVEP